MMSKLFLFIEHETELISVLLELAEQQQKALIKYDIIEIEKLAVRQSKTSKNLRENEEQRLKLLMGWLQISRKDALNISLSSLEKYAEPDELDLLKKLRQHISKKINLLNYMNTTNRVLTNKANNSIGKILSLFTNGTNHVCNVRV